MRSLFVCILGGALACATAGHAQSNLVLLISSPGEYLAQGQTLDTTNTVDFSVGFNGPPPVPAVLVGAFGFSMFFHAPGQSNLTVGTYSNAVRYPLNGNSPGLSVLNGRSCSAVCGDFQVYEIHTDGSGNIDRFWATFSHRCECGGGLLTGEIRFHSQLAPPTPLPRTLRVPADFPTIQAALDNTSPLTVHRVMVDPGTYNGIGAVRGEARPTAQRLRYHGHVHHCAAGNHRGQFQRRAARCADARIHCRGQYDRHRNRRLSAGHLQCDCELRNGNQLHLRFTHAAQQPGHRLLGSRPVPHLHRRAVRRGQSV